MDDDVVINKVATIERCIQRVHKTYQKNNFMNDFDMQDIVILNILRACEAALDIAFHLVRELKLGVPQSSRDVFTLLANKELISEELANNLGNMVGFRNIATHAYQDINLIIVQKIIENHLDKLQVFSQIALRI